MKHKIRASEKASVGFVWLSAALTIGALFLILGYIIWNGLFYSNRREYQVLSEVSTELDGSVLVTNKSLGVSELPFDVARNIFSDEYVSWKKICSKDVDLYPFADDKTAARIGELLALEAPGELIAYPGDAASTVNEVSGNPGGAAFVDRADFDALDPRIKQSVTVVRLRALAFAANPEVTALKDNHRVGTIDEAALASLYGGKVRDWRAFDGSAIPVVMVVPPENSPLYGIAKKLGYSASSAGNGVSFLKASSEDEYYSLIASTPGAAGVVSANKVSSSGLSTIKLSRQESGRNLSLDFILQAPKESGKIGGISTIILNTLLMICLTLLFSIPPGLFAAIYLVEYAKEGRLIRLIRLGTETLAGVPSIIFGLFGMLVFVQGLGWGISLLSGSLTVTLMILPTIVRTSEEALKSVSRSLHEGSVALGATKVQTIFRVVLPAAFPAISSGIILAIGRALGETAALIYTMGSNYNLTSGLFSSTRTLAVHIYLIIAEGISSERAFASGTVLIFFILIINTSARFFINRMGRMARA